MIIWNVKNVYVDQEEMMENVKVLRKKDVLYNYIYYINK